MTDPQNRLRGTSRGVSPVVATVLLVAITLLLAATASVYFSTLTDPPTTEPDAEFDFGIAQRCFSADALRITHVGGENVDPSRTYAVVDGNSTSFAALGADDPMTAGSSITLNQSNGNYDVDMQYDELRIVWVHPNNEDSFVLATYDVPNHPCATPRVSTGARGSG